MSSLEVWLIILLVVGVIASNLAVLKYSAKFKMPQFGDPKKNAKPQEGQPDMHPAEDSAEGSGKNSAAADAETLDETSKAESPKGQSGDKPE
ncbi:DUF2897 family protein [Shewanella cyperi]|uniref:DUF2897 family protein n=1 Tax=Shewanella cyperi TaxID=2814292 RepID=A0A975ALV9_9GAMM|nr:DUF2897 family protein [Shewanella cyperi]QSX31857.1 DUF2897 family protein [Shewanella cyperi]